MKDSMPCRFCNIIKGQYTYPDIDEPILVSDEFIAMVSIGALIDGWTLVIPKTHSCSMKLAYNDNRFKAFMHSLLTIMNSKYGRLVAFEHGANKEGSLTGCGINHAHLHIVPMQNSLLKELYDSNLKWKHCFTSEINQIIANKEYLFYIDSNFEIGWDNPKGLIHVLEKPVSQFFRKLISDHIGRSECFDYKQFPLLSESAQARKNLTYINL